MLLQAKADTEIRMGDQVPLQHKLLTASAVLLVWDIQSTPLMTAAEDGRVGSIKVLLQYGAQLQATEPWVRNNSAAGATGSLLWQTGDTALHKAGWRGMVAAVETLLENGADVHATNIVRAVTHD